MTFKRNIQIFRDQAQGLKPKELTQKYGLSTSRIAQIIANIERRIRFLIRQKDARPRIEIYKDIFEEYAKQIKEVQADTYKLIGRNNRKITSIIAQQREALKEMRWATWDSIDWVDDDPDE